MDINIHVKTKPNLDVFRNYISMNIHIINLSSDVNEFHGYHIHLPYYYVLAISVDIYIHIIRF